MAVRLFVGNLSYSTTEADLRTYFGAVAPPSQVVLPVDRETGRPRGFAFVEYVDRSHAETAIQRFNGQVFNGRPVRGGRVEGIRRDPLTCLVDGRRIELPTSALRTRRSPS